MLGGAAAAWPLVARAQQPSRVPFVGVLMTGSENDPDSKLRIAGLHQGFEEAGLKSGQNIRIEFRWAEGRYNRLQAMAVDLVRRQVAVIVATGGSRSVLAAKAATSTIPIVGGANGHTPARTSAQ